MGIKKKRGDKKNGELEEVLKRAEKGEKRAKERERERERERESIEMKMKRKEMDIIKIKKIKE